VILTIGFSYGGWIAFGNSVYNFRSPGTAFVTLFRALVDAQVLIWVCS